MNRKQQVAVILIVLYFLVNIQTNLDDLFISEDELLRRFLEDPRLVDDPNLEDLDYDSLKALSSHLVFYIRGKTLISLVNTVLLVYLFASYLDMYRKTNASFTLGLVFLSGALLSYSLFTNPVLLSITGEEGIIQFIRYFNFFPDLFTTVASTILIYLSRQ
jgi:hypothetical protein